MADTGQYPSLAEIRAVRDRISGLVEKTPVSRLSPGVVEPILGPGAVVTLKLELFQRTGTFKPRGALNNCLSLSREQRHRGVTALSAGNHAIALAWAAAKVKTSAKVVMPKTSNPARVELCRSFGGEVVIVDDVHAALAKVAELERTEGRTFVHPFEGPLTVAGTGTLGLELMDQAPDLEAVVVPVGGGGLAAGVAAAVKQVSPDIKVYGVEPQGADSMSRSFESGRPEALETIATIADSLGAPRAEPYSFGVCRRFIDELVRVDDDQLCAALYFLFSRAKLAVEPAGAAATAAMLGPLRERLAHRRVGVIVCGTNIDAAGYAALLARGEKVNLSGRGF